MAANILIPQTAPPRITFLGMDEVAQRGFRTSYRADVQHDEHAAPHAHGGPWHAVELLELTLHPHNSDDYRAPDSAGARAVWEVTSYHLPRTIRVFRALHAMRDDDDDPRQPATLDQPMLAAAGPQWPAHLSRAFDIVEVRMRFWRRGVEVPTLAQHDLDLFVPYDRHMRPTEFRFLRVDATPPTFDNPNPKLVMLARAARYGV